MKGTIARDFRLRFIQELSPQALKGRIRFRIRCYIRIRKTNVIVINQQLLNMKQRGIISIIKIKYGTSFSSQNQVSKAEWDLHQNLDQRSATQLSASSSKIHVSKVGQNLWHNLDYRGSRLILYFSRKNFVTIEGWKLPHNLDQKSETQFSASSRKN